MGLLSNEKQRNKLVRFLINHNLKLAVLLYVVGLGWFLSLAYKPLNAGTYFSENALLPGLVESDLPHTLKQAAQLKDEVKAEINKDQKSTPQAWIYEKFKALGLDTYRQNFSVVYPFKSVTNRVVPGENVYAILRARRAASTEAVVMSVPLRPVAAKQKPATGGGIALALALAQEFKVKPYWAKDIIFLFTDFDEVGTLAFLDAYHESTTSEYIQSNPLEGRSGAIQAAINLELPLERISYYDLKLEGLNGQLPNLDLVNLVVKLCRKERGQVAIHEVLATPGPYSLYDRPTGESFEDYKLALKTMLKMMWYQASGAPSGNHGLFHKFHIEALTLHGVKEKKGTRVHDLSSTAKVVEGIFRSLNNLQERFHQSFFFYVLPATDRYVSIGMYMPPFGLMAAAGLIKGLALWVGSDQPPEQESTNASKKKNDEDGKKEKEKEEDKEKDEDEKEEEVKEQNETEKDDDNLLSAQIKKKDDKKETEKSEEQDDGIAKAAAKAILDDEDDELDIPATGILTVIPVILICLLLAWMAYQGPEMLTRIMPKFRIQMEDMVFFSMMAIYGAAIMYPKLMTRRATTPNKFVLDWRLLKSIALICQTLALSSIAVFNISQAFFLTAFMVPVTTLVKPTANRFLRWFQMAALILVSPLVLMLLVGLISVWPQPDTLSLISEAFGSAKELIFLSVMDTYLFNTWTMSVLTGIIFPIWLFFWAIPWARP